MCFYSACVTIDYMYAINKVLYYYCMIVRLLFDNFCKLDVITAQSNHISFT